MNPADPPAPAATTIPLDEYIRLLKARDMLQFIHDNWGQIALFGWSGADVRRLAKQGLS